MARTGRGGRRTATNPAPVSGPGALSQRTDKAQPVRVAPGGPYGSRQRLENQQKAAPLPDTASAGPDTVPTGGTLPSLAQPPTGTPAGLAAPPPPENPAQVLADLDPDTLLRIMYRKYPHPLLARLLGG